MNHCHRYLKALHPISLSPFVDWPIPTIVKLRRVVLKVSLDSL